MDVKDWPRSVISSEALADWLEQQHDSWWMVDGDPTLTGRVDFPCPSDELADAIRQEKRALHVANRDANPGAEDYALKGQDLDHLADTENPHRHRTFLFRWDGDTIDWLLSEDEPIT